MDVDASFEELSETYWKVLREINCTKGDGQFSELNSIAPIFITQVGVDGNYGNEVGENCNGCACRL